MPAITNVDELQAMNDDLTGDYWLANDIDASATVGWNGGAGFAPIGTVFPDITARFTGHFDGKRYEISGLTINRPATNYIGLFGCIEGAGVAIKNVGLVGGSITGQHVVGALVGSYRSGDIDNCYSTAPVSGDNHTIGGLFGSIPEGVIVTNCYSTGDVDTRNVVSSSGIGGFAGEIKGTVSNCYCTGNVTMVSPNDSTNGGFTGRVSQTAIVFQCYCTGDVTGGDNYTGGFTGDNWGSIADSYARGSVAGVNRVGGFAARNGRLAGPYTGIILTCYSTGAVSGTNNFGGLIGENELGTITNCFWDTQTSGQAASDGGTGKTTSQMKSKSTFTDAGWDFIIIWGINGITNNGYAFFWAMPPEAIPDAPRETVLVEDKITLESIRNVEMAAGGRFRVDKDGKAVYKSRYARNA